MKFENLNIYVAAKDFPPCYDPFKDGSKILVKSSGSEISNCFPTLQASGAQQSAFRAETIATDGTYWLHVGKSAGTGVNQSLSGQISKFNETSGHLQQVTDIVFDAYPAGGGLRYPHAFYDTVRSKFLLVSQGYTNSTYTVVCQVIDPATGTVESTDILLSAATNTIDYPRMDVFQMALAQRNGKTFLVMNGNASSFGENYKIFSIDITNLSAPVVRKDDAYDSSADNIPPTFIIGKESVAADGKVVFTNAYGKWSDRDKYVMWEYDPELGTFERHYVDLTPVFGNTYDLFSTWSRYPLVYHAGEDCWYTYVRWRSGPVAPQMIAFNRDGTIKASIAVSTATGPGHCVYAYTASNGKIRAYLEGSHERFLEYTLSGATFTLDYDSNNDSNSRVDFESWTGPTSQGSQCASANDGNNMITSGNSPIAIKGQGTILKVLLGGGGNTYAFTEIDGQLSLQPATEVGNDYPFSRVVTLMFIPKDPAEKPVSLPALVSNYQGGDLAGLTPDGNTLFEIRDPKNTADNKKETVSVASRLYALTVSSSCALGGPGWVLRMSSNPAEDLSA